jgi:hypothetical protein
MDGYITDNDIGVEGAKALGEALKLNSTIITTLNLGGIKHFFYSFIHDNYNYNV